MSVLACTNPCSIRVNVTYMVVLNIRYEWFSGTAKGNRKSQHWKSQVTKSMPFEIANKNKNNYWLVVWTIYFPYIGNGHPN